MKGGGGVFQKVTTNKLCQNENFENGGTTIQIGILHVLLNILSISLLCRVHDMRCKRSSHVILGFEEN